MAFVAALPAIAAVAGIAGAGVSAYGMYESGQAAKEQGQATANAANYSAQVAANNALIAEQNATHAEAAGRAQAEAVSLKGRQTAARIKVAQAASGIDVNTGSASDVQASQAEKNTLDTETVMSNAELQAYGYRTQGTGYTAEAGLDTAKGQQAVIGGNLAATGDYLRGGGGLLSSISSVGSKWSQSGYTPNSSPITEFPAQPTDI